MAPRTLAVIAVLMCSAGALVLARQAQVFRADIQTVPVYVTVVGPDGHLVTDLTKDGFEILDDGRAQKITLFDNSIQPISIIVMLDMSGSMSGNIGILRSAAVQMFMRLLPKDKARVGSFGNRIVIAPDEYTNDVDALTRALWFDSAPGGPTPLWGAVNAAMAALGRVDGRRVVLVLSDGKNTGLRMVSGTAVGPTLKETIARAATEDFMVYAIGMRSKEDQGVRGPGGGLGGGRAGRGRSPMPASSSEPDPGLRELADDSGGGYFELSGTENLGSVFAAVADELHRQYLLGFVAPAADGQVHHIDVRLPGQELHVRARRSYMAPRQR